jgi:predicted cation transporter
VPDLPEGAELAGEIEHVLTHRRLKIKVYRARAVGAGAAPLPPAEARSAMPSLFRKALDAAL